MQAALDALRSDRLTPAAFCAELRGQANLLGTLPPRYAEVLQQLLDRLEASALFTEESCSFSQRDLLDSLQIWIEQARARLSP
jgi:hypothetical protein